MNMTVLIGGYIPESALKDMAKILSEDRIVTIDGHESILPSPNQLLYHNVRQPLKLTTLLDIDGSTGRYSHTMNLDDFCKDNALTYSKLIPPMVCIKGDRYNECICYWEPGMTDDVIVPTDGEGEPVIRQVDLIEFLDDVFELEESVDLAECGLLINEKGLDAAYAKEKLAGTSLREIVKKLLISRVGSPDHDVPNFGVLRGR